MRFWQKPQKHSCTKRQQQSGRYALVDTADGFNPVSLTISPTISSSMVPISPQHASKQTVGAQVSMENILCFLLATLH